MRLIVESEADHAGLTSIFDQAGESGESGESGGVVSDYGMRPLPDPMEPTAE